MKIKVLLLLFCCLSFEAFSQKTVKLFDGKSFKGLEGDTIKTWRIENGVLAGGSLTETVPHNEFISTIETYTNFSLKLKFRLTGTSGFINSGIQFHSKRIDDPPYEMMGYQADIGDGFWGCLYDESRRNKILVHADTALIKKVLRRDQWNEYKIRSENGRIRIWLNGKKTVDYKEADPSIPQSGLIAFQIHGGGKAEVSFKDIVLEKLR